MANTNPSLIHIVAANGSKIPIFTGRPTDLKQWLAALKKKQWIYTLTDLRLINLAYDFSDDIVWEWIGNYLDDHPDIPSKDLFEELTAQYGDFVNFTDAARALMKVKQKKKKNRRIASRISEQNVESWKVSVSGLGVKGRTSCTSTASWIFYWLS